MKTGLWNLILLITHVLFLLYVFCEWGLLYSNDVMIKGGTYPALTAATTTNGHKDVIL